MNTSDMDSNPGSYRPV